MAKKLYEETNIQDIANAIRSQNGTQNQYTVAQMPAAVRAIHSQPQLETLDADHNGNYVPGIGMDGFSSVHVNVESGEAVVQPLSVMANGTYTPPSGVDGYAPVMVNVSGGSIPVILEADWDAMTTAQKQAYSFCVIQTGSSGFERGKYVNGADYVPFAVYYTGTATNNVSVSVDLVNNSKLIVIAMNSEAITQQLVTAATLDGNALSGTDVAFNSYKDPGSTNRRNYRITSFDIPSGVHDLAINLSAYSSYSSFAYIVLETEYTTINKELSTPDAETTGTNGSNGMVLYGTFAGNSGGAIQAAIYAAGDTIATQNPGSGYKSSYIFWFV